MRSGRVMTDSWRDGGRLVVLVRARLEAARTSLFAVPVVWISAAVGLSQFITWVDLETQDNEAFPGFLDTTVESARALLGAIAAGTISAASVVFSLTLVAIQMSSSVYTSRVLRSFLRDRFQQNMIGIVLATFTYSLLVLREVRGPLDAEGSAYIPRVSVFLAVLFALAAVLALLASISHTSLSLRASSVTRRLVEEMVELVETSLPEPADRFGIDGANEHDADGRPATDSDPMTSAAKSAEAGPPRRLPAEPGTVLAADRRGWVQQISLQAIRESIDDGTTVRIDVSPGSYVGTGTPLLVLWPPPRADDLESAMNELRGAFAIGEQRTMQQDLAFGFTMLEDIANKALSPGVNDPNTAAAVIEQLGEVVLAVLERRLHPASMSLDGCEFIRSRETYHDIVVAAFNQIRHFAIGQPSVQLVLVRTLTETGDELIRRRRDTPDALDALRMMLRHVEVDLVPVETDPAAARARTLISASSWYEPYVSATTRAPS
jgi:uncharacterized membrane protein